jgi:curved DNA-binding protein CbpA
MNGVTATTDPYATLQLPHTASSLEIKNAYRSMARKYHPDKYVSMDAEAQENATARFAECAAAYSLLSDQQRKAEYDHIYKYGGFDSNNEPQEESQQQQQQNDTMRRSKSASRMSVGYACSDPCTFLWSQDRIESRRTVAGIHLPSKIQRAAFGAPVANDFGVTFSSGRVINCPTSGTTTMISETKKYYPLEKRIQTITETVTLHSDGRKDVVIVEGDGNSKSNTKIERRQQFSTFHTPTNHQRIHKEYPWYIHAWNQVHDKLSMCYNPCAVRD